MAKHAWWLSVIARVAIISKVGVLAKAEVEGLEDISIQYMQSMHAVQKVDRGL
jgi:hypothetical protein